MTGGFLLMTLMIRGELVLVLPALSVVLAVLIVFV
jgi:hypothetical protein